MSDEVDNTDIKSAVVLEAALADHHRATLADNVPFIAGDCEKCEEPSERLVQCTDKVEGLIWACARCRDKYKLLNRRV